MASPWQVLFELVGERVDEDLLPAIYEAASVPTSEVRAWLRERGLPHLDPEVGEVATLQEVEAAAEQVVSQAQGRAAMLGGVSGLAGAVAIPPEVLATLIHNLRLAQRLAVMFGVDPETDRGKMILWRALAAAYQFELPASGAVGLKVRDLPQALRAQVPATQQAAGWLARQVVWRSVMSVAGRVTRVIPGFGAGVGAWGGYRRTATMGQRMIGVYRRAADAAPFELVDEEQAVEVR